MNAETETSRHDPLRAPAARGEAGARAPMRGARTALRVGVPLLLLLTTTLVGATEVVRWLGIQFWQPWTCRPALNLHVFQREPGPFDLIFLGPSTLQRSILPEVLGPELEKAVGREVRFFCLAQPGAKYRTYRTIVRELVRGEKTPKLIVLAVGAELFHETEQSKDYFRYYATLEDLVFHWDLGGLDVFSDPESRERLTFFGTSAVQGAVRGIPTLWQWLGAFFVGGEYHERCAELRASRGFPELGWDIRRASPIAWQAGMEARLDHLRLMTTTYDLEGPEARALEETLALLAERDIPTVVVRTTTAKITEAVYRMPRARQLTQYYQEVARRHGAEFVDLNRPELAPHVSKFNDPYHPNREGAAELTPYWAREVLAPRLRPLLAAQ